jgi:hypothetical protein
MTFVDVYSKTTGRKQRVPEHWLDHPTLGRNFRKTPLSAKQQREAEAAAAVPANHNTPPAGDKE